MNDITEIIYGDSLYHTLKQCEFVGNKIIKFDKFLSFADLSNIDKNIIMLNKDFCDFIYPEINHKFDVVESMEDLNKELDSAVKRNSKIRSSCFDETTGFFNAQNRLVYAHDCFR